MLAHSRLRSPFGDHITFLHIFKMVCTVHSLQVGYYYRFHSVLICSYQIVFLISWPQILQYFPAFFSLFHNSYLYSVFCIPLFIPYKSKFLFYLFLTVLGSPRTFWECSSKRMVRKEFSSF